MSQSPSPVHDGASDLPLESAAPSSNGSHLTNSRAAVRLPVSARHLDKLCRALRAALGGAGEDPPFAIWIAGEAGSGKGSLISRAAEQLAECGVCFLRSEVYPETGEVLEPILGAARSLMARLRAAEEGGDARDRAELAGCREHIARHHAPALHRVLPEVDWGGDVEPYPDLEPRYERNRLLDHLAQLFLHVAAHRPVVICTEGAEHLDVLSRELLENLARVIRTRREGARAGLPMPAPPRLALVFTSCHDERSPVAAPEAERLLIALRGLGRDDFGRLLEELVGGEVPLSCREKLYHLTRGNPLELLLRVRLDHHRFAATGGPATSVVDAMECVQRLLQGPRLEAEMALFLRSLAALERRLLELLALAGRPLAGDLAARVLDCGEEEFAGCVGRLAAQGWLARREDGAVEIPTARLRAAVAAARDPEASVALHGALADAVEERHAGRPLRRAREVFHHRAAGPRDAAFIAAGRRAADEAERLYDFEGAAAITRSLLEALSESPVEQLHDGLCAMTRVLGASTAVDRVLLETLEHLVDRRGPELDIERHAGLWRRLGELAHLWHLDDVEVAYVRRGLRVVESAERSPERMKIYAALARNCLDRRQLDDTARYCQEGLRLSELAELTDDPEFLELCRVTEETHYRRGDYVEARRFEEQYQALAAERGSVLDRVQSLFRLAHLLELDGEVEGARAALRAARPLALESGSRLLQARADERLGYLHARQGDWPSAREAFRRALGVQSEIGDHVRTSRLLGALGMVSFYLGDAADGARQFRLFALYHRVVEHAELPPLVPGLAVDVRNRSERDDRIRIRQETLARGKELSSQMAVECASELGDLLRDRGELEAARRVLREGIWRARRAQQPAAILDFQVGVVHRLQGEVDAALGSFQRALDAIPGGAERTLIAEINLQVGALQRSRGEFGRALNSTVRGLRIYLECGHDAGVAHALVLLARCHFLIGAPRVAEEIAQAALALADSVDVPRLEAEAWLLLGRVRGAGAAAAGLQEVTLAREMFHKLGALKGRCRALLAEAEILRRTGDLQAARATCGEALEIARDLGLRPQLAIGLAIRGELEGDCRDLPRAVRTLEIALEHARELRDRLLEVRVHGGFAGLYHQRERTGSAREHLEHARTVLGGLVADCPAARRRALIEAQPVAELLRAYGMLARRRGGTASRRRDGSVVA